MWITYIYRELMVTRKQPETTYGTRAANGGPWFRDGRDLERGFPDERHVDAPPETPANGGEPSDACTTR